MVWIYWLIIVLKSTCECVLWINGIELKWFLVWIVETELDELWCLLTWITWTIVNAYWSIGPLQSLVLKEHRWLLDIQYTPQGIDESLKWFKFVHFNSWLWQLKTNGHNATFASKSLTDTETHYANTEWELPPIIFGCEKFHMHLYVLCPIAWLSYM